MTDKIDNLVLEHLKRIQAEFGGLRDQNREIITRLGQLEISMADHTRLWAEHSVRLDRVNDRLERIELRLELVSGELQHG